MSPTLRVLLSIALALFTVFLVDQVKPKLQTELKVKPSLLELGLGLVLVLMLFTAYSLILSMFQLRAVI